MVTHWTTSVNNKYLYLFTICYRIAVVKIQVSTLQVNLKLTVRRYGKLSKFYSYVCNNDKNVWYGIKIYDMLKYDKITFIVTIIVIVIVFIVRNAITIRVFFWIRFPVSIEVLCTSHSIASSRILIVLNCFWLCHYVTKWTSINALYILFI